MKKAKGVKKKQSSVTKSAEPDGTALYDRNSDASAGTDSDLEETDSDSEKGV